MGFIHRLRKNGSWINFRAGGNCNLPTAPFWLDFIREIKDKAAASGIIASRSLFGRGDQEMRLRFIGISFAVMLLPVAANAQLTIDMDAIKCNQYLAMSPAMSRDFSAWVSGWFSFQTRRTFVDLALHQKNIANLKAWCKYHPKESVMAGLQKAIGPQ